MAVLFGNLGLLIDGTSLRTILPERKSRLLTLDLILNLPKPKPKRDSHPNPISVSYLATKNYDEPDGEIRRDGVRGRANSKSNGMDFEADNKDEGGSGKGWGEEEEEEEEEVVEESWEMKMRRRVKELEEEKELEKKAAELQSRMGAEGDGSGGEETEVQKRMRVRKELEKVAKEQAERRKTATLMFELGQKAYGRGMYGRSVEYLEGALTIIPRPTLFGGEIQIWLAMAYEANNRHADCIALYKQLEAKHPMVSIRRQAGELRYILQAPKLKITQEERVSIPLIGSSYDSYAVTWSDKYKNRPQRITASSTDQLPSSRNFLADFLVWRPPVGWEKTRAFWIALTCWFCLVGVAIVVQR